MSYTVVYVALGRISLFHINMMELDCYEYHIS